MRELGAFGIDQTALSLNNNLDAIALVRKAGAVDFHCCSVDVVVAKKHTSQSQHTVGKSMVGNRNTTGHVPCFILVRRITVFRRQAVEYINFETANTYGGSYSGFPGGTMTRMRLSNPQPSQKTE